MSRDLKVANESGLMGKISSFVTIYFNFSSFYPRSVPLPKDVEHFKRERKLAINKSLQVCVECKLYLLFR